MDYDWHETTIDGHPARWRYAKGETKMVKTNDLKKGTRVQLSNGWYATLADNAKGNIRMAEVEGFFTETGSVYSHDIVRARIANENAPEGFTWEEVEHTPAQLKLRKAVSAMGF